jgi:hypothetical protein
MQIKAIGYDDKSDHYYWNDQLQFVKPYYLTPQLAYEDQDDPEQITVAAGGRSDDIIFRIPDVGGFEGAYLNSSFSSDGTSNPFLVYIFDEERQKPITLKPCHTDCVFGLGGQNTFGATYGSSIGPGILPETLWMDHGESIIMSFFDIGGNGGTITPVIHGQRFFADNVDDPMIRRYLIGRKKRSTRVLPCFAPLDENPVVLPASSEREFYYTNPNYMMFEVTKILLGPDDYRRGLAEQTSDNFQFTIVDEVRQHITQRWIDARAGMGVGVEPFMFYGPLAVRAKGRLTFRFKNETQSEITFYVTLAGRQFFI